MHGRIDTKLGPLTVSIAIPVSTVAKALSILDPPLASAVFDSGHDDQPPRTTSNWINLEQSHFEPLEPGTTQEADLREVSLPDIRDLPLVRSDTAEPVRQLQANADAGAKSMINLVATECLITSGQKQRCYEVSITEGEQQYREVGRGGKLGLPVRNPFAEKRPRGFLWAESSWADYLGSVADSTWTLQGLLDNKYIFNGEGRPEDQRCSFSEFPISVPVFQDYHSAWRGPVDCYEFLVTNLNFDVLKLYTEFRPPTHCRIEKLDVVVSYQWVKLAEIDKPMLVPFEERMSARLRNTDKIMTGMAVWLDYRKFRAEHTIRF